MKVEREKGMYTEHDQDGDHSDHDDTTLRRDSDDSTPAMSSTKTEDLATPLTSPSSSPIPKTLFLPSELSQAAFSQFAESNVSFYQAYDRQSTNSVLNVPVSGPFMCDELSLSWLDSVAMDDTYSFPLQNSDDFSLMNL